MRFFNRLGATEIDPDTVCNKAGHVALDYVYGASETGFDPRTARDAACVLVWGANPSASAPHVDEHWLTELPGELIVVDPIRTPTAARADLHLQPFPGSDAALAFALLSVIRARGAARQSIPRRAHGRMGGAEPLLDGLDAGWGEAITGVPAELIEEAALLYARGPSLLWLGQGLQRQRTGGNVMRACAVLPAATGNLGRPGAGFLYLNGSDSRGIDFDYLTGARPAEATPASPISQMDLAETLEDPARTGASSPGTSTSQRRTPTRHDSTGRSRARTCSRSSSTCSRPTPCASPTSSCRRRASSSSTTWCAPTST